MSTPGISITTHIITTSSTAYQFLYMMLAIATVDGHGLSKHIAQRRMLYVLVIYFKVRGILPVVQY